MPAVLPRQGAIESVNDTMAQDKRGVAVVGNPYSGRGPNRRHVDRLLAALESVGLEPRTAWQPDERRALLTDPALPRWCRCVVSAGGDGSLADVVNELAQQPANAQTPLAALPIGTENLFAREFGFTRCTDSLAQAIARGHTRPVDAGAANGRLFTLMVSAGFDADVVHRMAHWRSGASGASGNVGLRRVSRLNYVPRILRSLHGYGYPPLSIETDTGQRVTGVHLLIFNLPQYGGNLGVARHACCDDAQLDWIMFQKPGVLSLTAYAWSVLRARHLDRLDVPHGQARRLTVESPLPVPMQVDGDPAGWTPSTVEVRPRALRVVVTGEGGDKVTR